MALSRGSLGSGGGRRVRGRLNNGASSPRVSLTRTSPRTRYCCPRSAGEHVEQTVSTATSSGDRLPHLDQAYLTASVDTDLSFV